MNKQMNELRFEDMQSTSRSIDEPVWMSCVATTMASSTGTLPRTSDQLTWKAFSGVGYSNTQSVRSSTIIGLAERQRKIRGEA